MATGAAAALLTCPQYQVQSSGASKFRNATAKVLARTFAYHPPSRFDLTVSLCSFRLSYGLTFNGLAVLELHLGFWRFSACLTFLQDSLKMHWFLEVKGLGFLYADHRNRADFQRPVVLRSLQGRNLTRDSSALTTALDMFDVCFKCEGGSVN